MQHELQKKLERLRIEKGLSLDQAAQLLHVSPALVDLIENGAVTHPNIAKRFGKFYGLTLLETEALMPLNRRKHGGAYEPDKYYINPDILEYSVTRKTRKEKHYE